MVLPNFIIVGVQKGGTTWLSQILSEHPQVFLPKPEIHFFDKNANFDQGIKWYEKHFAEANNYLAIGEKTPEYLYKQEKHKVIKEYLPNIKSIVVLRNPVTRALSHLNHLFRSGYYPISINPEEIIFDRSSTVLDRGFYFQQLNSYFQVYNPEQVLILINEEDIAIDGNIALKTTCDFLNIDSSF